jgi:cyclic beta-1,2-glucan synthetase
VRHGAGYTVFEHNSHAIEQELTTFVPVDENGGEPVSIRRLKLRNDSSRTRRLSVTFYVEWTLGDHRESIATHVATAWDRSARAIMARNHYRPDYGECISFASLSPSPQTYTADRAEFLGRNGNLAAPAAMSRVELSGRVGAGLDPCAALQTMVVELAPGETTDLTCLLGEAGSLDEVSALVKKYRNRVAVDEALTRTKRWWDQLLDTVQVETPALSVNLLCNRWLLYQTLSCRIWGRSGFYQSGGAFGFRDQLQDVCTLLHAAPEVAREHVIRAAKRQFREGDVQHWWHPESGVGVRSRCSDDLLWLPYAVSQYVQVTGDVEILQEKIPFLEGRPLEEGEHEAIGVPQPTEEKAPLHEHCRLALERGLTAGPHGLPLIGIGDWNDGLNRVGVEGKGESVWLAWFLIDVLRRFTEVMDRAGLGEHVAPYRGQAERLAEAIENEAWDGAWYRRGYFDDGTPLGSIKNREAWIDSLPQSWAVLSGAADPNHARQALESAYEHLVINDEKLVLLFTPAFDKTKQSPGYIHAYPPGVRENGGQYTHGALWLAMAFARLGDGDRSHSLLDMLNPIEVAREPEDVDRYVVEPYVVAADIYRLCDRVGQGGWTWYTGSAGWMYRAWLEEVVGVKVCGNTMWIDPVLPSSWDKVAVRYRHGKALYEITIENPDGLNRGVCWVEMDGRRLEDTAIPLEKDRIKHRVRVQLGTCV